MTDKYILDDHGNPIPEPDVLAWSRWFEKAERHLAQDEIGGVRVSTVFLGLDHSFGFGPPVLWETMIFGGPLGQHGHEYQERYTTREEALAGHRHAVWLASN